MVGLGTDRPEATLSVLENARDRVLLAGATGAEPLALVASPDVLMAMRADADALRYFTVSRPEVWSETFMSLPVEMVEGADHLSVRVARPERQGPA